MSNQYFTSKRHIPQKDSEVGVCHEYKCVDSLVKFFRRSKAFADSACKPNPGHMQQYKDDNGKVSCKLYHLELCSGAADEGKTTVNPSIQCVRNIRDLGCNCRLYGQAAKNTQVAGVEGNSSEVILPFRIMEDAITLKRVAAPKKPLDFGAKQSGRCQGNCRPWRQNPTGSTGGTGGTGGTGKASVRLPLSGFNFRA